MQAAASFPFLLHSLLAITAYHVASEYPHARLHYVQLADRQCSGAMACFRSSVTAISGGNFYAVINFCRLRSVGVMAADKCSIDQNVSRHDSQDLDLVPKWVATQREGCQLIWPHRRFFQEGRLGPARRLLEAHSFEEIDLALNPDDRHLEALLPLFDGLPDDKKGTYQTSLYELRRAFALAFRSCRCVNYRDAAALWTVRTPTAYFDCLRSREPHALVLFAHYCALLSRVEEKFWYIQGQAERLLEKTVRCLDVDWHHWVEWPSKVVGIGNREPPEDGWLMDATLLDRIIY